LGFNKQQTASRFDRLPTGIITATLLPVIIYFLLYFSKLQSIGSTLFSSNLMISNLLPVLLSHCIIPDLIAFFIFNSFNWLKAAKGVLITTVILTAGVFAIKLIFRII